MSGSRVHVHVNQLCSTSGDQIRYLLYLLTWLTWFTCTAKRTKFLETGIMPRDELIDRSSRILVQASALTSGQLVLASPSGEANTRGGSIGGGGERRSVRGCGRMTEVFFCVECLRWYLGANDSTFVCMDLL